MPELLPSFESVLLRRFGALAPFEDGDQAFLARIAGRARDSHRADARLWNDLNPQRHPAIIVSGWACVAQELTSGARQILEILLPGDIIGFCARPRLAPSPMTLALTPLRTVTASELTAVWNEPQRTPRMAERLGAVLAEQHFLLSRQIVRLGRTSAQGKVAHLLSELHWRLHSRGLADETSLPMPLTQEQIADTLGLSVVHVNRTLQQLRRKRLIVQQKRHMQLPDIEAIHAIGEFTPPRSGHP